MSYLIHYNKNHSKANGQFISGDGDGDGIVNDNKNQRKSSSKNKKKTIKKAKAENGVSSLSSKIQRDGAIFCSTYKKYGLSGALTMIGAASEADNFIDFLSK